MKTRTWLAGLSGLTLALASSCVGGDGIRLPDGESDPEGPQGDPATWQPGDDAGECNVDALLAPQSYGAKVKSLLTGYGLTDTELSALRDDPNALGGLIDTWLQTRESEAALERFFMSAFQQTGGNNESFFGFFNRNNTATGFYQSPRSPNADEMLNQNFAESFARTVTVMNREGRPFSDVLTTDTFMMTTAMMSFLAFTDDEVVNDDGTRTVRTTAGHFNEITLVRDQQDAPPASQALDPNHPNFATFWHPRLASQLDPVSCNVQASQTIDTTQNVNGEWRINTSPAYFVFSAVALGRMQSVRRHNVAGCNTNASNIAPLLNRDDFSDWRMVRVRPPDDGGTADWFYDAPGLRGADELRLHTPRVGFFTAPGFLGTWPTNEDNSARVTINQTLIVALGASFEGEAVSDFTPQIDEEHATGECYGCHQTLDPMRDYFRASFTNFYGQQLDEERTDLQADFVFGGAQEEGSGVHDLADTLQAHELFPYAWAHKLCYWANGDACAEGEELDRIAATFVESNFQFKVLVRELFSSPLVTGSACVSGVDAGTTATIARRSTFCNSLSHRLGFEDLCALRTHFRDADDLQDDMRDAVASVPDDAFSRAEVRPVVITETGLFARANREAACSIIAQDGFDSVFGDLSEEEALDVMVNDLMGLPESDERHDEIRQVLLDHIEEVLASEGGEGDRTVALQSAMAVACMSPGTAGVGF